MEQYAINIVADMGIPQRTSESYLAAVMRHTGRTIVRPPDPVRTLYVFAHVDVTPQHTKQAIAAIRSYVEAARREPGAMRLEAMEEIMPNHFDIIEVWRDDATYQAHEASQSTVRFHDTIAPWRGSPFEERVGSLVN